MGGWEAHVIRNYLITALRNIVRHKLYSFINIAGLAVGLACVVFVILFVRDELSYDKWIPGTQNLYRVEKIGHPPGRDPLYLAVVPFVLPAAMRDGIPEVTAIARISYTMMTLMTGDRPFREQVASVDPNFFQIIKLPLAKGDPAAVFRDPESVVISQSAARKYFGTAEAIGKIIKTTANCESDADRTACLSRWVPLKITGIIRDIPHNSQLDGEMFIPNTSITNRMSQSDKTSWFGNNSYGYVSLSAGADPRAVIAKMGAIFDRAATAEIQAYGDHRTGSQAYAIHLTPFTDVHLTAGRWSSSETPAGSWTTLYGVIIVGFLVLFLACFNFTNLSTARALLRAREIALRKTHGANRRQLTIQFLGEAVFMTLLSLVLALALVEILLPPFGRFLGHPVPLHYVSDWPLLMVIVGIAISAGLISGSYPALVLSAFRPVAALQANNAGQAGSGRLRTVLVVLQFAVSIALGVAAMVVFAQISFARNIDLGYRKDNTLVVIGNGLLTVGGRESFVQRLRSNPDILDIAMMDWPPLNRSMALSSGRLAGHPEQVPLYRRVIGTNAVPFLGMKLVAGRLLSDKRTQDETDITEKSLTGSGNDRNALINQAMAAALGLTPAQAIGRTIIWDKNHAHIVGVLADVKFDGARDPAKPSLFVYDPNFPAYALIRIRPDAMPQTLAFIDRAWHDFAPTKAVWRYFLDDNFSKLYQADERQGEVFGVFVVIAIFISCLGLFGLAAFTAGRRTKEIGIRKAFGARTRDIVLLLLWQFSIPVFLANAIAWPVAWYYLHGWLEGFAYHISLSPLYFLGSGAVAMVIAWVTVFTHARRVANANPIYALRYE
jgi:putative ABC transport system permease protein